MRTKDELMAVRSGRVRAADRVAPRAGLIAAAIAGAGLGALIAPIATLAAITLAGVVYAAGARRAAAVIAGVLVGLAIAGVRIDRSNRHRPAPAAHAVTRRAHHVPRRRAR